MQRYLLNNPGGLEPGLLFSATNYTNFTNFPLFFVLIREICPESPKDSWKVIDSTVQPEELGSFSARAFYDPTAHWPWVAPRQFLHQPLHVSRIEWLAGA